MTVYQTAIDCLNKKITYEAFLNQSILNIFREAVQHNSKDNLSLIIKCFDSFANKYKYQCINELQAIINQMTQHVQYKSPNNKEKFYPYLNFKQILGKPIESYENKNNKNTKQKHKKSSSFCCGLFSKSPNLKRGDKYKI